MNGGAVIEQWPLAYRPLAARSLLAQLALLVAVETLIFRSYSHHEAGFHWATHFLVGLTVASLILAAWLALKGAPARGQLLWVLAMHLLAMFPDLLFSPGQLPHYGWMDLFLGHVSAHYVPGGTTTWLVVALAASGSYAWLLARWLGARRSEADAGLAPGIGIGGDALLRPQHSPRTELLAHSRFGPSAPPEVVLLHGLGASQTVWRDVVAELEGRDVPGIAVDLLGFGGSRRVGTEFGLDAHVAAAQALLDRWDADHLTVAGHSFGCAVAAALAEADTRVQSLVFVSPPVFRDGSGARERLGRRGWLARRVLAGSPVASVTCGLMCLARPLAARAIVRASRNVPEEVALDSVQHSWPAYRDALTTLLEANPLPTAIGRPRVPTVVVLSDADDQAPAEDVLSWPHGEVTIVSLEGDHLVPLNHPRAVADAIAEARTY